MDQPPQRSASAVRAYQLHPGRGAIIDLFNLYLGRSSRQNTDDSVKEPPNKTQKRVVALNRELPPRNEQFILDFQQLLVQFGDQDQLRAVTESVLISLVVQCSSHAPRAEFLLFALRSLCSIGHINWDTLLPSLLSSVSSAEMSIGQTSKSMPSMSTSGLPQSGAIQPSNVIPNTSSFQPSNPASPLTSVHGIGSPTQSMIEPSSGATMSPAKFTDQSIRVNSSIKDSAISNLRQLCCKIIMTSLDFNLKPATHAEIFSHMLTWLVNWDQRQQDSDDYDGAKFWRPDKALTEWLHNCLDVIWLLVDQDKCRMPFYELLRSGLQFIENIPDDEALFTLILEIHRRRDLMAMHMLMLDQHLHCPTFGTHRILSLTTPNVSGEGLSNLRYSPITYPSVLGESLHGEELANTIQRGSLDWERALRCVRHAIRTTPSPDWWKRVLLVAPSYRLSGQLLTAGAVFTSEMICEAIICRIIELLKLTNSDLNCWPEWLCFSDLFFFLVKSGCIDFVDFVDKLFDRISERDPHFLRTNHVTWLLTQIMRVELVITALNTDTRKGEATRKLLSFHREDRSADPNSARSILLDFISNVQNLRIWTLSTSMREYSNNEKIQKGKQINEWWKQVTKGDLMMDYMNMDEHSLGMFWVVSYAMTQPAMEAVMNWLFPGGHTDLLPGSNERLMLMREVSPLPMSLLSGFSIHLCLKLVQQMEDSMFLSQVVPSIAMVETYTRLLLIAPHSLFRPHINNLTQKNSALLSKPGVTLLLFEIINYRLLPLYRYQGKTKTLMYDVAKIIAACKGKRGEQRVFRLAENLCMNVIFSLRDFFLVKREGKGPNEFTETLNRLTVMTLAILIKTRGIADADHILFVPTMLEQLLATSQHTWSEKTLRYFPPLLRDALAGRIDKKALVIQAWQKAETTVISQCTQLISPSVDPSYFSTYINHSFPEHRQYLCAGAWTLMLRHPESINSANLVRVLREFSPEEVTTNIYTMVDVLLHNIQVEHQHGHLLQDLLTKTCTNLAFFIWTNELLPLDILLLALIDRDDDPHALNIVISLLERQELTQRMKVYIVNYGPPEHWLRTAAFKRTELLKALGNHLSWKDRYPPFFDDIVARLLPVIPLVIYRFIENDFIDATERLLSLFTQFLAFHPFRFSLVRDMLAYFYGHLPGKLVVRILGILDVKKVPFSEQFLQLVSATNSTCPPLDYFASLLQNLVNNVIPPLNSNLVRPPHNQTPPTNQTKVSSENQKAFYQIQDPGTYTQLILETSLIEILSLPVPASQIVSSLVQIIVNIQPTLIQSNNLHGAPNSIGGQGSVLPTSPSGGSTDSLSASRSSPSSNPSNFVWRSAYTSEQLSCLLIQACGLLLSQLPTDFHVQLYLQASQIIKESWWLNDSKRSRGELDSAVKFALLDPSWAAQDNTSTAISNVIALLHSFFSNLPQEWLEGTHVIIKNLKPVTSVAMLRIAFRIMGPLLPRLANAHSLFNKTLSVLLGVIVDVFGKRTQPPVPVEASEITDLIDFLHHVVHYEAQGGPVQPSSRPRPDVLVLFSNVAESLRPDVQHLLSHLKPDVNSSIYAMPHPKITQSQPQ
ncbi:hypothetical protein SAY87_024669 [Trapa incisa]|uniref:Mediator of RNA polymerase II transcription subunit 23 n=1 Tax=Trapa incisa TaxID=236973 RepID=A0AAN7J8U8_9MYRT|nr:hypothetical protein SAY87_024669 [Trapa incisa]